MAVGKIEYKKILKDTDLTPTKLKDLYVSMLKEDNSFEGYDKDFAEDPTKRYTIMTPEDAASLISNRRQSSDDRENSDENITNTVEETAEETTEESAKPKTYPQIQGGIWPTTIGSQFNINSSISPAFTTLSKTFSDKHDFVKQLTDAYVYELQKRGYDPAFAEYLVAQDALESTWGVDQAGKNNFGGIKGKGSMQQTKEWNGQTMEPVVASFRNFNNLQDYINYKINLVGNSNYNVFAYSPSEYFNRVKAGGYATDPNYVSKLNDVLQSVRKYS